MRSQNVEEDVDDKVCFRFAKFILFFWGVLDWKLQAKKKRKILTFLIIEKSKTKLEKMKGNFCF